MEIKTAEVNCPKCNEAIRIKYPVERSNASYPNVRSNLKPIGDILVYRISSEQIKDFIIQKARQYVQDVRIMIVPRYCEKKRKNNRDPHRSYASLRIGFSENVVEEKTDLGWYGEIGDTGSNVKLQKGIMNGLIKQYQYNRKEIDRWLKDYKTLEELEEGLGMTEAYINDLRMYAVPQRIKADNNENWIIFAAAAENVIADMLTETGTNVVPGRIQINDVYPISKDIVEFVIYVHPTQMKVRENPHVRQILLGEEKPKK
jgi:hypothetical protein